MILATLLEHARFGYIFPLAYRSKLPMRHWEYGKQAHLFRTSDPAVIEKWYNDPIAVNGRIFSKRPGHDHPWAWIPFLCVIDGDVKDGAPGLESIASAGGCSKTTRRIKTPSGGFHWYFASDPSVPHHSENGWLPGVDIRYGKGLILIPGSVVRKGEYKVLVDVPLDQVEPMPEWVKEKLKHPKPRPNRTRISSNNNSISLNPEQQEILLCIKCDSNDREKAVWKAWSRIERVRGRFFNCRYAEENKRTWICKPAKGQTDCTQSGYEWQLAKKFYSVGATDEEVIDAYIFWTWRNGKRPRKKFVNKIMPGAKAAATPGLDKWNAKQPKRRKHGTTREQIKAAIRAGHVEPQEIQAATGLEGSSVRTMLGRMIEDEALVKDGCRYAIAEATRPQDQSPEPGGSLGTLRSDVTV